MFSVSFNSAVSGDSMERERSSKPGAQSSNVLQTLKEFMHHKDLQISLLKLGIYSSVQNLPAVKDLKSNASSSMIKSIDELKVDEISEDFTGPDGVKEEDQTEKNAVINGRNLLKDSGASYSDEVVIQNSSSGKACVNSCNGNQVVQSSEIEKLSNRLKFLEEESKIMKQEFLQHAEERKQLVNEICQHFRAIYHYLQLEFPEYGEICSDESFIMDPYEVGELGTGLSEVCQDSSSCIASRDYGRTSIRAFKETPQK